MAAVQDFEFSHAKREINEQISNVRILLVLLVLIVVGLGFGMSLGFAGAVEQHDEQKLIKACLVHNDQVACNKLK